MQGLPLKEGGEYKDEAFVQCNRCKVAISKCTVQSQSSTQLEVEGAKAMGVKCMYGECLFLCLNCGDVLGQARNGKVMLSKDACMITRVEYRNCSKGYNEAHMMTSKDRYLKCVQELITFVEDFGRIQSNCEERLTSLQKTMSDMLESPLVAFLSTTDGLNE